MACAATLATGCSMIEGLAGGGGGGTEPSTGPKRPAAPLAQLTSDKKAGEIVFNYANLRNTAAGLYSAGHLKKVETGSLLETHVAELKILKRAKRKLPEVRGWSSEVMTPKNRGYPKWFVGLTHDREKTRVQMVLFVAEKAGGEEPVRGVLSVELDRATYQNLTKTIGDAEFLDAIEPGDASLVVAPQDMAGTHAQAVRAPNGPQAKLFASPDSITDIGRRVSLWGRYFTSAGWKGTSEVRAWPYPTYAIRLSNGASMMWYGVDVEHSYTNGGGGAPRKGLVGGRWGNVFPGLIGKSAVRQRLTGVERTEFAVYVPPKGQGKLTVVGSRWSPVKAEGE